MEGAEVLPAGRGDSPAASAQPAAQKVKTVGGGSVGSAADLREELPGGNHASKLIKNPAALLRFRQLPRLQKLRQVSRKGERF